MLLLKKKTIVICIHNVYSVALKVKKMVIHTYIVYSVALKLTAKNRYIHIKSKSTSLFRQAANVSFNLPRLVRKFK